MTSTEDVLAMIEDGGVVDAIAKVTGWTRRELIDLAREAGYGVNVASGRFQPGPKRKTGANGCLTCAEVDHLISAGESPHAIPGRLDMTADAVIRDLFRHQSPHANALQRTVLPERWAKEKERRDMPADAPTIRPAHRDLITEGKASSVAKVRRAAERAEAALQALADALDATRAAEAERRAREAEKAKKAARIAELKAELARLTGKAPTAARTPKASGAPSPSKAIRSWAEANGVDCPANGPVPRRVVEAYEAAIGGAA